MIERLRSVYSGKRVFLTGHTGFKGAWLLKILTMAGAQVKGYALAPKTENDLFHLIGGSEICDSVIADIRDAKRLSDELVDFKPDYVFHLAAQPLVRLSYEIPAETFEVNAIGTAYLLDAVRRVEGECKVILITTDKVYHNYEWVYPYRETDRLGGYDPYSASKACTELVIDSYRNSFFNLGKYPEHKKSIAVARAGNVIGGGDWSADRLVPDIIRAMFTNNEIVIRNPGSVRPWQHVLEPVTAYLLLGARLAGDPQKYSEAFNFGPDTADTLPVSAMVELAISEWGSGRQVNRSSADQPHEAGLLKLDISKAKTLLNWRPVMNASEAVAVTVQWYRQYKEDPIDIKRFTEKQVTEFLERSAEI
jgi:CDP-glucose 4,6-dehydratase